MLISQKKFGGYVVLTMLISSLVSVECLILMSSTNIQYDVCLRWFGWTGILLLLWGLYVFKKLTHTNINQYSIFYLCYFIFSYGQLILFSVGIEYDKFLVLRVFPQGDVIKYCLFFCISTCFFFLGALLAIKKDLQHGKIFAEEEPSNTLLRAVKIVAWALFFIAAPIYLFGLVTNVMISITQGYNAIYDINDSSPLSNIITSLSMWYVPSLFLLSWSYKQSRVAMCSITLLIAASIICVLIIGARSTAVAMIFSYIFLWNTIIKKLNKKNVFIILLLLFLFFTILPIIQVYRGTSGKSIESFLTLLIAMYDGNKSVEIIGELGGTMQVWLRIFEIIPSIYSFKFGESYLASLLACIPSLLMGGYSFTQDAQLAGWLQNAANMTYGPGFSMHGEAYYNFGWWGMPFMLVVGWVFFMFLNNGIIKGKLLSLKDTFSAIALCAFITTARGSMYLSIRKEIYMIVLPMLAIIVLNDTLRKRRIVK